MLQQHLLKVSWIGLNTYLGRLESSLRRLEPSWKRLEAARMRLGAGKNEDLSAYVFFKLNFQPICFNNTVWKRLVCVWKRIWAVSHILEPSWTVLKASWGRRLGAYMFKIKLSTYTLQQHFSKATCVRLKTYLSCLEACLSCLEPSWRRLEAP